MRGLPLRQFRIVFWPYRASGLQLIRMNFPDFSGHVHHVVQTISWSRFNLRAWWSFSTLCCWHSLMKISDLQFSHTQLHEVAIDGMWAQRPGFHRSVHCSLFIVHCSLDAFYCGRSWTFSVKPLLFRPVFTTTALSCWSHLPYHWLCWFYLHSPTPSFLDFEN